MDLVKETCQGLKKDSTKKRRETMRVTVWGRLVKDAAMRTTKSNGNQFLSFRIAEHSDRETAYYDVLKFFNSEEELASYQRLLPALVVGAGVFFQADLMPPRVDTWVDKTGKTQVRATQALITRGFIQLTDKKPVQPTESTIVEPTMEDDLIPF